jgi:hypothetical protein
VGAHDGKIDRSPIPLADTSVPQLNIDQQRMAISSLAIYASVCLLFLVVAPTTTNPTSLVQYDAESYARRGCARRTEARNECGSWQHRLSRPPTHLGPRPSQLVPS